MVLKLRIELKLLTYQVSVLPLYYKSMAGLERIELPPSVSKTEMISISPKPDVWQRV